MPEGEESVPYINRKLDGPILRRDGRFDFVFRKQDHTLGQLLVESLRKDDNIEFVACRIPDPHVSNMVMRIHTKKEGDELDSVRTASDSLVRLFEQLERDFILEDQRKPLLGGE